MNILGIETSCDETSAAVIKDGEKIIANTVATSQEIHRKTGGIIPESAAREQVRYIIPVIKETLLKAKTELTQIDALAVTIGPGLIGALLVGVETAKTISLVLNKPLIPVNHIFAHIYANWLDKKAPEFPAIALVVSGGHTELFYMESHQNLKWLGGTMDDAAGEAFDKSARMLGLPYPGGPSISAAASRYDLKSKKRITLPRPVINSGDFNFSFSGLKTAVLREINNLKENNNLTPETVNEIAFEIQEAITDVLVKKTMAAARQYNVKSVLLGGGVAANRRLTEKLNLAINNPSATLKTDSQISINLHIPPPSLCTDNAAYIAGYAYFHPDPVPWVKVQTRPDLEVEV